ncbi:MAG: hypothetical protein OEV42_14720 [Deltaproteobacteria bacterium]|nr:hypothetical protein [Deltaproteobacteria bacterium]
MRALAKSIVETAASAAGMPVANVMEKPDKASALHPLPRLEFETPDQDVKRNKRLFCKLPAADPDYVVHRYITHDITVKARVEIIGDSADYVESFFVAFMQALPGKTVDAGNNLVTVRPERAATGGYEYRAIDAFPKGAYRFG